MDDDRLDDAAGHEAAAPCPGQPWRSRRGFTWHPLATADDEFLRSARIRVRRSLLLDLYPQELWGHLAAADAAVLTGRIVTKVRWTARPAPGAGSVRELRVGRVLLLREHSYRWHQPCRASFGATAANRPTLRRFAEDYLIEATPTGSRLTWTVALELTRADGVLAPVVQLALGLIVASMLRGLRRQVYRAHDPGRGGRHGR